MRLALYALALSMAATTAWAQPARVDPKVGDPAPPFTLLGSDGRTYRLSDFTGKQVVVLAWFAKAFTGG